MTKHSQNPDWAKEWVMRYEELRAQALDAHHRSNSALGWALFIRKGMAAWLDAWKEHAPYYAPEPPVPRPAGVRVGAEQQQEIVTVWAGMVLGQLPERIGCTR